MDALSGLSSSYVTKNESKKKIPVTGKGQNKAEKIFIAVFIGLGLLAMLYLKLDMSQLVSGIKEIPSSLQKLAKVDFSSLDIALESLVESIAVSILATLYSMIIGLVLAIFIAKNLAPFKALSTVLSAIMTFLRAIPKIIWVLLILVCVGFGYTAGIIGISIASISFFSKSFAQCYEEVSDDTFEALRSVGANKLTIYFRAVLPSAFTSLIAWTSVSFESNFEASTVLGTVGAGGIGYVISNCMTRYSYGEAVVAIVIMLVFIYAMELSFTALKERHK